MSAEFPSVSKYSDGALLDAATMNVPIGQLESRTRWLKSKLDEVVSSKQLSTVRLPDAETEGNDFDCVYLDPETKTFKKALAGVVLESNPFEIAASSAVAVGVVIPQSQASALVLDGESRKRTIAMYGFVEFGGESSTEQDRLALVSGMVESDETFRNGPYYLSSTEAGKITASPRGPAIYIGTFSHGEHGTFALLAPQYKDLAEMHHHRAFALAAKTQGEIDESNEQRIRILGVRSVKADGYAPADYPAYLKFSGVFTGTRKHYYRITPQIANGSGGYVRWPGYTGNRAIDAMMWEDFSFDGNIETGIIQPFGSSVKLVNLGQNSMFVAGDTVVVSNGTTHAQAEVQSSGSLFVSFQDADKNFTVGETVSIFKLVSSSAVVGYSPVDRQSFSFAVGTHGLVATMVASEAGVIPDSELGTTDIWFVDTDSLRGWTESGDEDWPYKYEVGLDPALNKHFPPVPSSAASLVVNGFEQTSAALYGDNAVYKIDNTGLYWKPSRSDATPFRTQFAVIVSETLYLARGKLPSSSFVTSLKAAKGSGIKIRDEGTSGTANTGDLVIDCQIPVSKSVIGLAGYQVPKDVVGNTLVFGPVVSRLRPGPGILVQSSPGQTPNGCGDVLVSVDGFAGGQFDDVVLNNAKQELINLFPYVKLLGAEDVPSGFTLKMHVPQLSGLPDADNPVPSYSLLFGMSVFGLEDVEAGDDLAKRADVSIKAAVLQDWYPGYNGTGTVELDVSGTGFADNDAVVVSNGSISENSVINVSGSTGVVQLGNTMFEEGDVVSVTKVLSGSTQISGLIVHISDRSLYTGTLKSNSRMIETDELVGIQLGSTSGYAAFDPIFLHNDESFGEDPTGLKHCLVNFKIGGLRPNASVAILVSRAHSGSGDSEYLGELGFMNMSWRLVAETD